MINEESSVLIEKADRRLNEAMYKLPGHKPRIWDVNFAIAITFALIAIAKELLRMNNARHNEI